MKTISRVSVAFLVVLLHTAVSAQAQTAVPELNISLGEQRVRFAPTRGFQEMRLEVVNSVGEIVLSHTTVEAEFDWDLRAGNGETLTPGLYRYALMLKVSEELSRQHTGHFIVEKGQDQIWLTANEGAEVSGTALSSIRSGGRSLAGFRTSNDRSVKRDVSERHLVDDKGSASDTKPDQSKSIINTRAALAGTLNRLAKFAADGTTLVDSALIEDGGNVGIGATALPSSGLYQEKSGDSSRVRLRSYGGLGILFGERANGSLAAPTALASGNQIFFFGAGGYDGTAFKSNATAGLRVIAAQNWSNSAHGSYITLETTANGTTSNTERLRIDHNGNVGIGTTTPAAKLDVLGDIHSSALRQELTAYTPNVINGFLGTGISGATPGNRVTAGVIGANIGGGGFNGTLNFPTSGTVTGDNSNRVTDWFGTVGGGLANRAGSDDAGLDNAIAATVGGGSSNTASGNYATVSGGVSNTASGAFSTVLGGLGNLASGNFSAAGGHRAQAIHEGAFVWGDGTDADFSSTAANQFLIRASGGVGIGTNAPSARLDVRDAGAGTGIFSRSESGWGVRGDSPTNFGVYGKSGTSSGVYGESFLNIGVYGKSAQYEGVRGEASNFNHGGVVGAHTGAGIGVYGISAGTGTVGDSTGSGSGVFGRSVSGSGVRGESPVSSASAAGVMGVGTGNASVGVNGTANIGGAVGVLGQSSSLTGFGLYGRNSGGGRALYLEGNAAQTLNNNGLVKAMIYIDPFLPASQYIVRCYNGITNSSYGNCGFAIFRDGVGDYSVNFGFTVEDRFVSLTTRNFAVHGSASPFGDSVRVLLLNGYTFSPNFAESVDGRFYLIIY